MKKTNKNKNNNFLKFPNLNLIFTVVGVAALGYITFKLFNKGKEGFFSDDGGTQLVYYHMENCGHCKDFSPTWDEFVKKYTASEPESPLLLKKKERGEAERDGELEKYEINGFPSIVMISGDKKIKEYKGDRSVEDLIAFCSG